MKRVLSLGLAAVMTASLAACGSGSADTSGNAADTESTAAEAAGTTAEGSEGTASEGGTFKIGVIGPLTGDNAAYGLAVQNGAELAAKEINEAGGINGYTVETQSQDCLLYTSRCV